MRGARCRSTWYGERVVNARDDMSIGPARALPLAGVAPVEWRISDGLMAYEDALGAMEARVDAIAAGHARPNWSGCSSTRRSTPPAPAPSRRR